MTIQAKRNPLTAGTGKGSKQNLKGISMDTVQDYAHSRNSDPVTSYEAGDRLGRSENAELMNLVLNIIREHPGDSDHQIYQRYSARMGMVQRVPRTSNRIRVIRKQLEREGLVVSAGRREGVSATGGSAMTWEATA